MTRSFPLQDIFSHQRCMADRTFHTIRFRNSAKERITTHEAEVTNQPSLAAGVYSRRTEGLGRHCAGRTSVSNTILLEIDSAIIQLMVISIVQYQAMERLNCYLVDQLIRA